MNNQCPNCKTAIDAFFGIVNCPNCQQLLVIDIDGNIQVGDENAAPIAAEAPPVTEGSVGSDLPVDEWEAPAIENTQPSVADTKARQTSTRHLSDTEMGVQPPSPARTPVSPPADPAKTAIVSSTRTTPLSPRESLRDVVDFANSPHSAAQEGIYFFDVWISGVDSSDLRALLRECLQDKRMGWDSEQVVRNVQNGQLRIPNLSGVKASVLLSHLRDTPFLVRWEQHSLTEPRS